MLKIVTETMSSSVSGHGGVSPFGQNAASAIRDSREREKKEMSDLNDRLASYIEKVTIEIQADKMIKAFENLKAKLLKRYIQLKPGLHFYNKISTLTCFITD